MLDSSIAVVSPPNILGKSRKPINAVPIEYPKFLTFKIQLRRFSDHLGCINGEIGKLESKRPILY